MKEVDGLSCGSSKSSPSDNDVLVTLFPGHSSLLLLLPCLHSFCYTISYMDYPVPLGWDNGRPCIAIQSHLEDYSCIYISTG